MPPLAEGQPGSRPLPVALAELRRRRATGVLRATADTVVRELVMVDGELRAARSSADAERLGGWLVGRRRISEGDRRLLLQAQGQGHDFPFGHILVTRGMLPQDVLTQELADLARTIIERATVAVGGRLEFDEGARCRQPDTLPDATTCELILHASRVLPGLRVKRAALPGDDTTVWRAAPMDVILQAFELTVHEKILVGKLHRERSVAQLRDMTQLSEHSFAESLFALLQAGIVTTVGGEEAASFLAAPSDAASRGFTLAGGPPDAAQTLADVAAEQRGFRENVERLATRVASLTHYQILDLQNDASYQQVFDAWDAFRRRFDPARARAGTLADLAEPLRSLYEHGQEAFEVLSSPARRPRYDAMLRADECSVLPTPSGPTAPGPTTAPRSKAETAPASLTASRAETVEANLARVEQLRRGGDLFSAIRLLEQTADLDRSPEILLRLARLMLLNPHWANRALEKLRLAVDLDPRFVDGWLEVAEFWRRRKNPERQRKALERALVAAPDHPAAAEQYRRVAGDEALAELLARVRGAG